MLVYVPPLVIPVYSLLTVLAYNPVLLAVSGLVALAWVKDWSSSVHLNFLKLVTSLEL